MLTHGLLCRWTYDGDGNRVSETVGGTTTKFPAVDDRNPTGLPQVLDEVVERQRDQHVCLWPESHQRRESANQRDMDAKLLRLRRPRQRPLPSGELSGYAVTDMYQYAMLSACPLPAAARLRTNSCIAASGWITALGSMI